MRQLLWQMLAMSRSTTLPERRAVSTAARRRRLAPCGERRTPGPGSPGDSPPRQPRHAGAEDDHPGRRPGADAHPGQRQSVQPLRRRPGRQPPARAPRDRRHSRHRMAYRLVHHSPVREPVSRHRPARGHGPTGDNHRRPDNPRQGSWRPLPAACWRGTLTSRPAARRERGQRRRHGTAAAHHASARPVRAHLVHPPAARSGRHLPGKRA